MLLDNRNEELKRKPVELNLAAAKKRKSAQTGFIHHCYTSLPGERQDTIPLYENFCYALGLLRSRLSDHVLEAKALLEKLIAFEVGGNFPIYLHEYPECKDRGLSLHVLPVLHWVLSDFRLVLGEGLCGQLEGAIERILIHAERMHNERPLAPTVFAKWKAYADPQVLGEMSLTSAAEWADYLIALQMAQARGADVASSLTQVQALWHPSLHLFLGLNRQEKAEPEVTLFDLFFGHAQHSYAQRVLADHPVHLQASLVYPFSYTNETASDPFVQLTTEDPRQGYVLFWGDANMAHTLVCEHRNSILEAECGINGADLCITLPDHWEPSEQPEIPLSFFCNLADAHSLFINGQKATTFHLGDEVSIESEEQKISIQFTCTEGEGVFFGHLLRANRPTQKSCVGPFRFDAHDWQIALRTVRRSSHCRIAVKIRIFTK